MAARFRPRVLTLKEGGRSATVMVGPVRGPLHRDVIHRLGYYHVPVSAIAPSRAAVAFVAFYEGAAQFRTATGSIREYAVVLRVSRVSRGDLPGLTWPGRAGQDAPYYRFDLGPIRALPRPVMNPDRLRILFRYVELADLERAETLRTLGKPAGPVPAPPRAKRKAASANPPKAEAPP
jgi:hypothetical protein